MQYPETAPFNLFLNLEDAGINVKSFPPLKQTEFPNFSLEWKLKARITAEDILKSDMPDLQFPPDLLQHLEADMQENLALHASKFQKEQEEALSNTQQKFARLDTQVQIEMFEKDIENNEDDQQDDMQYARHSTESQMQILEDQNKAEKQKAFVGETVLKLARLGTDEQMALLEKKENEKQIEQEMKVDIDQIGDPESPNFGREPIVNNDQPGAEYLGAVVQEPEKESQPAENSNSESFIRKRISQVGHLESSKKIEIAVLLSQLGTMSMKDLNNRVTDIIGSEEASEPQPGANQEQEEQSPHVLPNVDVKKLSEEEQFEYALKLSAQTSNNSEKLDSVDQLESSQLKRKELEKMTSEEQLQYVLQMSSVGDNKDASELVWEYMNDQGNFVPYSEEINRKLTTSIKKKTGPVSHNSGFANVRIDPISMFQVDLNTNKRNYIRSRPRSCAVASKEIHNDIYAKNPFTDSIYAPKKLTSFTLCLNLPNDSVNIQKFPTSATLWQVWETIVSTHADVLDGKMFKLKYKGKIIEQEMISLPLEAMGITDGDEISIVFEDNS